MKIKITAILIILSMNAFAQNDSMNMNTADRLLKSNTKLSIGGYGEMNYNQEFDKDVRQNGNLDVHRMVLMFGYKFNDRTNFITEIEMEHVSELYVEQAFLQYRISNALNLRAGLMLVPMGIVNEFHEPTTFNGVERPDLDKYIVPTTWRENGIGITGNIKRINLKYQAYIMNGFSGHNEDQATFSAGNGLRGGRQKGAKSYMSSPTFSSKVDYYGVKGLKMGLAGYVGKSQSRYYDNIDRKDEVANTMADSTSIGISMIGFNAIYTKRAFQFRGQFNAIKLNNTKQYNSFFGSNLGSSILGYYAEVGYNLFFNNSKSGDLTPFLRYEKYNTQHKVESGFTAQEEYNRNSLTMGLGWKITPGTVFKADYQIFNNEEIGSQSVNRINLGAGVWF